jgi:hypothetical protein
MHPLAVYLLFFPLAAQADLYKCTDNTGKITYTNSACVKSGLKEAKLIPPPPPPVVDAPSKSIQQAKPAPAANKVADAAPRSRENASVQLMKADSGKNSACAKLNGDMGRTMDEMDAARGQASKHKQQAEWNDRLGRLQAEKNRLGCF